MAKTWLLRYIDFEFYFAEWLCSNTGEGTVEEVAMATKSDQVKVVNHVKGLLNDIVANKEEGVDKPSPERVQVSQQSKILLTDCYKNC